MSRTSTDDPKRARTREWVVVDAVPSNQSPVALPGNREKYWEIRRKAPLLQRRSRRILSLFKGVLVLLPARRNREREKANREIPAQQQRAAVVEPMPVLETVRARLTE